MVPTDDRTLTDPDGETTSDALAEDERDTHADLPPGETETDDEPETYKEPASPEREIFGSGP